MKIALALAAVFVCSIPAVAQQGTLNCDRNGFSHDRLVTHCEMREQTIAYPGRISVDPGTNGGIAIKAWDGAGVLVRSKVESAGADDGAAKIVGAQIQVNTSGGVINAIGPESSRDRNWSVSFEIFVPRQADLNLKANNGGITIAGVNGNIQFHTMNGGVHLQDVGGDVVGDTMNGGLTINLSGPRWNGNKLEARTTNGGINITVPQNFSAHFESSTVNGRVNTDFPVTVHGELGHSLSTDIGSGGPTIHVETVNGGVNLRRAS